MCADGSDDCEDALRAMYLYIDRELAGDETENVKVHLDDCFPCLQKFEFEAELKQIISSRCREEVPTHLYERIRMSLMMEIEKVAQAKTRPDESDRQDERQGSDGGIPGA